MTPYNMLKLNSVFVKYLNNETQQSTNLSIVIVIDASFKENDAFYRSRGVPSPPPPPY